STFNVKFSVAIFHPLYTRNSKALSKSHSLNALCLRLKKVADSIGFAYATSASHPNQSLRFDGFAPVI
ncbi:hypothetical protein, partial [Vibrio anguillarum]|uniref:hypothetical protein n=1 Tax=Vibrio anguillarum TaxID=55601 RepID=UPI001C0568C5